MTRSPLLPFLLAAPLWHGLLLGQQPPAQSTPTPVLDQAFRQFAALQHDEGRLVGAGVDYRARFDRDGAQFTPALGEQAPIEFPVTLRGVAFGRGAARQSLDAVEPTFRDRTVSFRRGAVDETYEVRPTGLKQSFVFDERPAGEGDLVVAVQVATQLALQAQGDDAVSFGNEFGGVRITSVLGIDARGSTCAGSMSYEGDQLLLRLPAAFVDHAALPLVLDPMVGAVFTVNATGRNLDPQVAYDAGLGKYLVVWWRRLSASTGDIYGQFVNRETTAGADLSGSSVVIRSGANSQRARVADCSVRNAFVVGWQDTVTLAPLPTHRDLFVRGVSPTALGATVPIAPSVSDENGLEMAGNATESSSTVLCAWLTDGDVMLTTVSMSASLGFTPGAMVTASGAGTNTAVRLPRSGGAANRCMLGWLTAAGTIGTRTYVGTTQVGTGNTLGGVRAYSGFALDGDGENWFLAAQMLEEGSTTLNDITAMTFGWNNLTNQRDLQNTGVVSAITGLQDFRPTVAMSGRNAVVAWTQGSTTQALGLRTFGQSLCLPCEPVITVQPGVTGQQLVACLASQASGGETGSTRDDALIVWQGDTGTTSAVQAQRWTPADGIATTVAPGCGGLTATAVDECSSHLGSHHMSILQNAPPNGLCWLVLGFTRRDASGCGTCVLVPDLATAFVLGITSTDDYGNAAFSIPIAGGSQLIGLSYYQQWLVQDFATPGCSTFLFDLSNALQVTIQ
ncbi:MAG: hypothetical protein MUC36_22325 [Planctomycetes bacterium]|jgi:hypothetical protein|nr:hypothetical protein [Planctomycetota bacterium]